MKIFQFIALKYENMFYEIDSEKKKLLESVVK